MKWITFFAIAFLLAVALFVSDAKAIWWVNAPTDCKYTYAAQSCIPIKVCGITGGDVAQCYDTSLLTSPIFSSESETQYSGSFDGGYLINCESLVDSGSPFCDNDGNYWCNTNSTCSAIHNKSICLANQWAGAGASECSNNCFSGWIQCFAADECDIQVGSACTPPGGGTGTWDASCNCIGIKPHLIHSTAATYNSTEDAAQAQQTGTGNYANFSNGNNKWLVVNNSGCLLLNSIEGSSWTCNLTGNGGGGGSGEPLWNSNFTAMSSTSCAAGTHVSSWNGSWNCTVDTGGYSPHSLLSATHNDTEVYSPPSVGDLIVGTVGLPNYWAHVPVGVDGAVLTANSLSINGIGWAYPDYSPWFNDSVMIAQKDSNLGVNVTWLNASVNVTTPIVYGSALTTGNLTLATFDNTIFSSFIHFLPLTSQTGLNILGGRLASTRGQDINITAAGGVIVDTAGGSVNLKAGNGKSLNGQGGSVSLESGAGGSHHGTAGVVKTFSYSDTIFNTTTDEIHDSAVIGRTMTINYGSGIIDFPKQSRARRVLDISILLLAGVWTPIPFDLLYFDEQNEFASTTTFTANCTSTKGYCYYQANCHLQFLDVQPDDLIGISLVVNGAFYASSFERISREGVDYHEEMLSDVIQLANLQTIECYGYSAGGAVVLGDAGEPMGWSYLSVHKLS